MWIVFFDFLLDLFRIMFGLYFGYEKLRCCNCRYMCYISVCCSFLVFFEIVFIFLIYGFYICSLFFFVVYFLFVCCNVFRFFKFEISRRKEELLS